MLVSEPALNRVIDDVKLGSTDFYLDRHKAIYEVMLDLYSADKPCDELTVNEALAGSNKVDEAGGKDYVSELAAKVPDPGNVYHYAEIVKENSLLRRLLNASHTIAASVNEREGSADELSDRAEQILFDVAHKDQGGDFRPINQILDAEVTRLEKLASGEIQMTGTPTGFLHLDARPSMGKTAFTLNIASYVGLHGGKVAFFSLEMSKMELAQRFIASRARISGDQLRKGKVAKRDWTKVIKACNELEDAPLWVDETSDLGLLDLRAKARRLHIREEAKGGLGLIIVDYLQLMRMDDSKSNRVEQVGQISRGLKLLANELEVPVVALSQLSRANESRPDKRPMLSDLRDSGNIEQDADLVAFLYREDVYRKDDDEKDGVAEVIIAKHRNGPVGTSHLTFLPNYPKFVEPAHQHPTGEGTPIAERAEAGQI